MIGIILSANLPASLWGIWVTIGVKRESNGIRSTKIHKTKIHQTKIPDIKQKLKGVKKDKFTGRPLPKHDDGGCAPG